MAKESIIALGHKLVVPLAIYQMNYEELSNALKYQNSEEGIRVLMPLRLKHKQEEYIDNITILIINYVASAKMLVDQCSRSVNKNPISTRFYNEYQEDKMRYFIGNENVAIVHLLRNYCVHYYCPPLIRLSDFMHSSDKKFARFALNPEAMKKYAINELVRLKNSNADTTSIKHAISYIESCEKYLEIEDVFQTYHKAVDEFYQKLLLRLGEYGSVHNA
jgi:hypothetical protein